MWGLKIYSIWRTVCCFSQEYLKKWVGYKKSLGYSMSNSIDWCIIFNAFSKRTKEHFLAISAIFHKCNYSTQRQLWFQSFHRDLLRCFRAVVREKLIWMRCVFQLRNTNRTHNEQKPEMCFSPRLDLFVTGFIQRIPDLTVYIYTLYTGGWNNGT